MVKNTPFLQAAIGPEKIRSCPVFLKQPLFTGLVKAIDLLLITTAAFAAYLIYSPLTSDRLAGGAYRYVFPSLLGSLFFIWALNRLGGYELKRLKQAGWQACRLLVLWGIVIGTFLAAAFFTKTAGDYSRLWTFLWTILALALLVTQRGCLSWLLNSYAHGLLKRRVAVVGAGDVLDRVVTRLRAYSDEISICGIFRDRQSSLPPGDGDVGASVDLDDLIRLTQQVEVDHVILAVPLGTQHRLNWLVDRLRQLPFEILVSVELSERRFPILSLVHVGDLPMLEVSSRPIKPWGAVSKWIEDKLLCLLMIVLTGPLMLFIAALVKWDSPGSVLFTQERYGFNNKIIKVLKFRTMYVGVEDRSGGQRTVRDDPRVTRVGRVLRALSLDELPQLFNVLKGEMSLVGPRPHAIAMKVGDSKYSDAVAEYAQRHRVKPGITGWAQINGLRGEVNSVEKGYVRVQHDLQYIERWSLWLDLKILALTVPAVLSRRNAF
jgi:Undecaprenyl-phosphate glucose phosphotransferase